MATLATPTPQEAAISEVLAKIPLPKGVKLRRVYFDNDWSGDPAVRIVYGVSKSQKIALTKARIRDIVALSNATSAAVRELQTDRFPYISFEDVR